MTHTNLATIEIFGDQTYEKKRVLIVSIVVK